MTSFHNLDILYIIDYETRDIMTGAARGAGKVNPSRAYYFTRFLDGVTLSCHFVIYLYFL